MCKMGIYNSHRHIVSRTFKIGPIFGPIGFLKIPNIITSQYSCQSSLIHKLVVKSIVYVVLEFFIISVRASAIGIQIL